ncbi:hypothetical protein O6H91_Y296900 [Diphasiastrum complanatum]|nr:hypothetical protein O6H91_Y296900 [Diphasiastrum complanatum]
MELQLYSFHSQQTETDRIDNGSHLFASNIEPIPCLPICNDIMVVVTSIESEEITMMAEKEGGMLVRTATDEDLSHTREYAEIPVRFQNRDSEDSCPCKVTDQILASCTNVSTLQEFAIQVQDGKDSSDADVHEDLNYTEGCAQELPVQLQNSNLEESCPCKATDQVASENDPTSREFAIQVPVGKDSSDQDINEDLDHTREYAMELPVQSQNSNLEESCPLKVTDKRASGSDCILEEFAIQARDVNNSRGTARSRSLSSSIRGSGLQEKVIVSDNESEVNANSGSLMVFWWESLARTVSAGLYLVDFVSTILVVKQHYDLDYHPAKNREFSHGHIQGAFPIFLVIVGMAHTLNAIAFKLALPPEHQPIRSAYFLPLLQLQRLISGLWATGSCDKRY